MFCAVLILRPEERVFVGRWKQRLCEAISVQVNRITRQEIGRLLSFPFLDFDS